MTSGLMRASQSSRLPLGEAKFVANRSAVTRAASGEKSGGGGSSLGSGWYSPSAWPSWSWSSWLISPSCAACWSGLGAAVSTLE